MGLRPTEGDEDLRKNHFTYDRVADVAQALSRGALWARRHSSRRWLPQAARASSGDSTRQAESLRHSGRTVKVILARSLRPSSKGRFWGLPALALLALLMAACGYHVGGHSDLMPATIRVIAIPPIANNTVRPKLPVLLATGITREFHERTKYTIVTDPNQADAVLKATIAKFVNFPTIADPASGRATGAGCIVTMNLLLTDRHTGKVLFSQVGVEFRERYEISIDPKTYFDESDTALERLSRDVAHSVVTAILEKF